MSQTNSSQTNRSQTNRAHGESASTGFAHFWPYYLRAHMDPRTRAFHYVGTLTGVVLVIVALVHGPWWLLPLGVVAGYGIAVPSHLLFEGNRPATLVNPHWSLVGDFYMLGLFITGRLGPEIERVRDLRDLAGHGMAP
ncbi:MAG TPA: DUF962 domain-containing protein [Stellaceae bacterium]|nr:DUF962 domain-containing protein [Stellaceae bacterium]